MKTIAEQTYNNERRKITLFASAILCCAIAFDIYGNNMIPINENKGVIIVTKNMPTEK